ncbi:MAG: hypothetical protein IT213_16585, partial [Cytophagales bacterium]|nr:hypothetical protein [Cytophagales bacterium]
MKLKNFILSSIGLLIAIGINAQVFTGPTDVCKTINQTYTYSDDVTYTSAQWSVTSGGTIVSGSGLTRQINWTANGTITVSLYNGASLVSQGTLNVYVFETGTISGPGTVTQGNSATITKVDQYGGFQWEVSTDGVNWTGLGSTPALVHTPTQNSQYRLKLNSACKTRFSNTVSVTVVAPLIITAEGPTSIPLGISTRLSVANNFYQYQWQKNGVDISGATVHYLDTSEPAEYTVKAKATAGSAWETSAAVTISSSLISQPTAISYKVTTSLKKEGLSPSSNFYSLQSHEVNQEVMYLDGHGRSLQQIAIGQTPNRKDLVVPVAYDHAGRTEIQYLPYATTVVNGQYKPTALKGPGPSGNYSTSEQRAFYQGSAGVATDAMPYTKSVFEQSPLSTIIEQGGVGSDLQPGSTHTIRSSILVSTSAYSDAALKNVRKWTPAGPNGMYDNLQLTIAQTIDENGNKVWQFTDKLGRTILKRVQLEDTQEGVSTPFLETYFVYDIRGNLTMQVPPKAMTLINGGTSWTTALRDEWCYQYNYDELNRLIEKKEPGVAPVYFAYDPLDRLVLTQDGNLRALNKWAFIKYDLKGRGIMTGLYLNTTHTTREAVQTNVLNNLYTSGAWYEERGTTLHGYTNQSFPTQNSNATALEVYTISYFDSYDLDNSGSNDFNYTTEGLAGEGSPFRTFNMPTASKQLVLGTSNWLYSYVFYDKYGRVIQMRGNNHLSLTIDNLITNVYNENGTLKNSKTTHKGAGGTVVTVLQTPEYDHAGRVLRISQSLNGGAQQVVAAYMYNELGQLIDKKLHETGANTFLQSVDYRYTIQGWLKSINNAQLATDNGITNHDPDSYRDDYFGLELMYNTTESGLSNTANYNGNISAVKWKGPGTTGVSDQRSYKYAYDKSDRLKTATFQAYTGSAWTKEAGTLNEALTYDANGNIKTLQRHQNQRGLSGTTVTATAQAIDNLTYTYASGQGNKLTKVDDAATAAGGFANGSTATTEYLYNTDGSQTKDDNKGISTITYNTLGKPQQVTFADGRTVSYTYSAGGSKLRMTTVVNSVTTTTDYVGSFVYENNALSYFGSPEGRIVKNGA